MTSIRESVRRRFEPVKPLASGVFAYLSPPDDPRNFRLHLRIEPNGSGLLILNGSTVMHLNQTATEYAYCLVQGFSDEHAARQVSGRYRVSFDQAQQDFRNFVDRLDTLIVTPDLDPVTFLDFDRERPYSGPIASPYRLDCALTYRTRPDEDAGTEELSSADWEKVIDKAWAAWIPHIFFTGGEPTLREDLLLLIEHAGVNGQVTGLATDGRRLVEPGYLEKLLQTGLDHLLLLLPNDEKDDWTAVQNAILADIFTTAHLTLTQENSKHIADQMKRLSQMGLTSISLSADSLDLSDQLLVARDLAASLGLTLVWDLPVPHSRISPITVEMEGRDRPQGAGRAWLYVEPNGDVRPSIGMEPKLGNLLQDPWEKIWQTTPQE
jgi:organic radical activating enzyme